MGDPLNDALALLQHAADDKGNCELDRLQATALLVDRESLFQLAKQLKVEMAQAVEEEREKCAAWAVEVLSNGVVALSAREVGDAILFREKP